MPTHPTVASPARIVAARVLLELERDEETDSGNLLDRHIREASLTDRDARLGAALVFTVLRHEYLLDLQYREFLTQPPSRLSAETRVLLRMAAAQKFYFERLPEYAIANDSVTLAREHLRVMPREAGFVNAVVRKLLSLPAMKRPPGNPAHALSVTYSHPQWLVDLIAAEFGNSWTETILETNNEEPSLVLRANRLRTTRDDLASQLQELEIETLPGSLAPDALVLEEPGQLRRALESEAFSNGFFYIQDEASQLVPVLAAPRAGETVLDLCAAPGGKTTQMAELAGGQAKITASDISLLRLKMLGENLQRLRTPGVGVLHIEKVRELAASTGPKFDLVLIDAPCSGLGTIRRNPEIRYRCTPEDIERLAGEQLRLLNFGRSLVRPGGRIVYSTCTFTTRENSEVVRRFLEAHPEFSIEAAPDLPPAIEVLRDPDGIYRVWPHHLDMDAFETAILRRNR